jgi:hypothetical protein
MVRAGTGTGTGRRHGLVCGAGLALEAGCAGAGHGSTPWRCWAAGAPRADPGRIGSSLPLHATRSAVRHVSGPSFSLS